MLDFRHSFEASVYGFWTCELGFCCPWVERLADREMREISASGHSSPRGGSKGLSARKMHSGGAGRGNGFFRKPKVLETKKRKRRLILDDSESDDYLVYERQHRTQIDENESAACFRSGKTRALQLPDSTEEPEVKVKIVLRPESQCYGEWQNDGDASEKHATSGLENKMIYNNVSREDPDHDAVHQKVTRLESLDIGKGKTDGSETKRVSLDSVRFSIGKALIRASRTLCSDKTAEGDQCSSKKTVVASSEVNGCSRAVVEDSSPMRLKTARISCGEVGIKDPEMIPSIMGALCKDEKINGQGFISSQGQHADEKESPSSSEDTESTKKSHTSETVETRSAHSSDCSKSKALDSYLPSEDRKTEVSHDTKKFSDLPAGGDQNSFFLDRRKCRKKLVSSPAVEESKAPKRKQHILAAEKNTSRNVENQRSPKKPNPLRLQKSQMQKSKRSSADKSTAFDSPESGAVSGSKSCMRTQRQMLRDEIKGLLLRAGWKIEVKPRRGKSYQDSVYISPEGSGFWSITKAYSVLREQVSLIDNIGDKKVEDEGYPSTSSNDLANQFSAIPADMLAMLKRKTSLRKTKCVTSSRSVKIKKVVAVKKEINENGIVGSSRKKKNRRGYALLARRANQETDSAGDIYVPYAGRRSVLTWLMDSGTVPINGKVKYMNKRRTKVMLEGVITRDGILCKCCSKTLTVSKFEIHAGSKVKQPYANIFFDGSGISLLQCLLDTLKRQDESKRCAIQLVSVTEEDPNDDTCAICGDGGNLICCDSCPSTFHLCCLGIKMPPPGDWHCMNCLCRFCGQADSSTNKGDSADGSLLLSCGQCGEKYHRVCTSDIVATRVNSNYSGTSFCGKTCGMIHDKLQSLVGVRNNFDSGFSWTLARRFYDDFLEPSPELALRAECNAKVAIALSVMDECFLPIFDQRSGINLIPNVLFNCGSNFSRLDYGGFYTFILEQGDEILSAASVRVHGKILAEMPFIATRHIYRRRGMCRRLLNEIEKALVSLKVEKLVIPAIPDLLDTWTKVFGFEPLKDSDYEEIRNMNMLVFPGTGLLKKHLLPRQGVPTFSLLHRSKPSPSDVAFQAGDEDNHGGKHASDGVDTRNQDDGDGDGDDDDDDDDDDPDLGSSLMIQDVCGGKDGACKLAQDAAGADCCA